MSLRSDQVDAEIATILLGTNASKLRDLIDDAGLSPLVNAYVLEHFDADSVEELENAQIRDVLAFIATFRALAKGASG